MSNAFEAFAEQVVPSRAERRERNADRRAANLRRLKEEAQLSKSARLVERERLDRILAGPFGEDVYELRRFLRRMTIDDAPLLIELVDASPFRQTDEETRFVVLSLIDKAIVRLRIGAGLPPFDDGLDTEPPRALHVIKAVLGVR